MKMYRCKFPNCGCLIDHSGYCDKHLEYYKNATTLKEAQMFLGATRTNSPLYNTSEWRKLRKLKLKNQPCCQVCGSTENLQVDHIVPPRGDSEAFFNYENLQVLCSRCHFKKTRQEIAERQRDLEEQLRTQRL